MQLKHYQRIKEIKARLDLGIIDYATAKQEAEQPISEMQKVADAIAKKHGFKPRKLSFTSLMR